jgi:hypothetical protein
MPPTVVAPANSSRPTSVVAVSDAGVLRPMTAVDSPGDVFSLSLAGALLWIATESQYGTQFGGPWTTLAYDRPRDLLIGATGG